MAALDAMRSEFPDASHHCWAYLLGDPERATGAAMSDDGEPGGTAGKPILNVLQHKAIGNVMLIVARWFGGVKLGAGGLTRAYSAAASAAMDGLPVTRHVPQIQADIELDFAAEQDLRHWLDQHGGRMIDCHWREKVCCRVTLPREKQAKLIASAAARGWRVRDQ